jgi:hypothetical protein
VCSKLYSPCLRLSVPNVTDFWFRGAYNWFLPRYIGNSGRQVGPLPRATKKHKEGPVLILKILVDCHWILCYGKFDPAMRQSGEFATQFD